MSTDPSSCRHCGISKHDHYSQWSPMPIGWHTWTEPTHAQRKVRIFANAVARRTAKEGHADER